MSQWAGVTQATITAVTPYAAPAGGGYGPEGSTAQSRLNSNGGLSLSAAQAQALSDGAYNQVYNQLANAYNNAAPFADFGQLPPGAQTALFDLAYNSGVPGIQNTNLWGQYVQGDWSAAYNNLMNYGSTDQALNQRAQGDAALLKKDIDSGNIPSPASPCN